MKKVDLEQKVLPESLKALIGKPRHTVVVGSGNYSGAKIFRWDAGEGDKFSLAEFDCIIVDVPSLIRRLYEIKSSAPIPRHELKNLIELMSDNQRYISNDIFKQLDEGRPVIVLGAAPLSYHFKTRSRHTNFPFPHVGHTISAYDWCPYDTLCVEDRGQTREVLVKDLSEYFENIKHWSYYFKLDRRRNGKWGTSISK